MTLTKEDGQHLPKLSVVIVNINQRGLLLKCLQSVFREVQDSTLEVIVVDNDSTDGSPAAVRAMFPQVTLLQTVGRQGFAQNYNAGIRAATGEYILVLNNDTELLPVSNGKKLLDAMVEYMEQEPQVGCLGPMLLRPSGRIQFDCARSTLRLRDWVFMTLWLDQLFPKSPLFGNFNMTYWDHTTLRFVDSLLGAFILVRKSVIDRVGMFDERFFLMAEDLDFCKRVRDAGFRILYCPQFRVLHVGNQTIRQGESYAARIETTLSTYKYFKKHRPTRACLLRGLAILLMLPKIIMAENALIGPLLGRPSLPIRDRLAACVSLLSWRSMYTGERVR